MISREEGTATFYPAAGPRIIPRPPGANLDGSIVKVAVRNAIDTSKNPQLITLDQKRPLSVIIEEICTEWQYPDSAAYAIKFNGTPSIYITEMNRNDLANGDVLLLNFSSTKQSRDILFKLKSDISDVKSPALAQLAVLAMDPTFAHEFISQTGLDTTMSLIESRAFEGSDLTNLLTSFNGLMEHSGTVWDVLSEKVIIEIASYVTGRTKMVKQCTLTAALGIMELLVLNSNTNLPITEREVPIETLIRHLDNSDPLVQQNALALINSLFLKAPSGSKDGIETLLRSKAVSTSLMNSVFDDRRVNSSEMEHQLYVLQTLLLNMLDDRRLRPLVPTDSASIEKLNELRKIVFENPSEPMSPTSTRKLQSAHAREYKKLGFKHCNNPADDFQDTPPGLLALDCMLYFAQHYNDCYTRIVLENSCRSDNHECLFAITAIKLTSLLADILHIGQQPSETGQEYFEMLFKHEHPFEEMFCICVNLLNKTWREMHATVADVDKVMSVVKEQIKRSLTPRQRSEFGPVERPRTYDEFKMELGKYNYNKIQSIWQQERSLREKEEFEAKPILELKKDLEPEILELIKTNRLNTLKLGHVFTKYGRGERGTREKGKFWFWKLSPNGKTFHFDDCKEKDATFKIDELKNTLAVSDIKDLITGKNCPMMRDPKNKNLVKTSSHLAFSIEIESIDGFYNFVSDNDKTFHIWTDGFNSLLNKKMESPMAKQDLDLLLSLELKIQLLNIEGIDIPNQPPVIPPYPDNSDFCYEYNQ